MRSVIYILLLMLIGSDKLASQTNDLIFVKHFTKKNKVVLRVLPKNKTSFDETTAKAIEVVRYDNINGVLTNSIVIEDLLRSFHIADTLNWMKLFRKDKDKAGFIYSMLYPTNTNEKLAADEKTKFEKMTFDMMLLSCDLDRDIANACGLYLADSSISNSKKYTYKIAMYTNSMSATTNQLLSLDIDASQLSTNKNITDLKGKSKKRVCTINWQAANYNSDYSGYNIYRSTDNVNFKKVNRSPVILLSTQFEKNKRYIHYGDTMREANKKYYYHIKGINFFGEEGDASNVFTTISITDVTSIPFIDSAKVIQNKMVKLKWRMEDDKETTLPKKYILMRSDKDNGVYKTIYESSTNLNYSDRSPGQLNFYRVAAVLINDDTLFSYSRFANIIDTIAPASPKDLKAIVDKKGIVTISWTKSKESDLQGYKLFKSNRLNDEFVQINNKFITDSFTTDKLNLKTLSKKIYYKIAASDNNFNASALSEAIEVKRPDTIPPQAPILVSVSQKTNCIEVRYILSNSDDVNKEILFKKKIDEIEFKDYYTFDPKDSTGIILDTLVEPGQTYEYQLRSSDEDKNISYSRSLDVLFETGFRKKINDITFTVDRTSKKIDLTWKYDEKNVEKYVIYRSKKDEIPTIVKTLEGNTLQFTDKTVNMGNVYEYRIKAAMANGAESIISSPVTVEY
ncbi:MAG: hypothetical protein IPI93_10820 [Sphingobacteriaceae bacterium]|nr:hypothetical protein [Sphingobacteriaceae bacterium]